MTKKFTIRLFLSCMIIFSQKALPAQLYNRADIDFLLKKITMVYAGYKDKVKDGRFKKLVQLCRLDPGKDSFAVLSRITSYFADHHLSIYQKKLNKHIDTALCRLQYERLRIPGNKETKTSRYEGYWINELNSTVIYLQETGKNKFEGCVIETRVPGVPAGYCILRLNNNTSAKGLTDYINIDGELRVFTRSHFKDDSVLIVNSFSKWHKLKNYQKNILQQRLPVVTTPSLTLLDSTTVLIRMNNFSSKGIAGFYDSLIKANSVSIASCKNLIIDIRNNGGGSIRGFFSLLPFFCTTPLFNVGSYQLCSNDLIEDARQSRKLYSERNDTTLVAEYDKFIARMMEHKNTFIYTPPDTLPCNPVSSRIKNVALLINHGCRSAAELMVLMLKQNNKVKTFGENTAGAVDYLDMIVYELPVSKFTFWVGTSKRKITRSAPKFDNSGIQPDITISENVTDWVAFVKKFYE